MEYAELVEEVNNRQYAMHDPDDQDEMVALESWYVEDRGRRRCAVAAAAAPAPQAPRRADAALQVGHGEAVVDGDDDAPREERGEVRERGVAREEHVGAGQVPEVIGHEILRRQQPIGVLVVLRKAPAHAPREPLREAALFDEGVEFLPQLRFRGVGEKDHVHLVVEGRAPRRVRVDLRERVGVKGHGDVPPLGHVAAPHVDGHAQRARRRRARVARGAAERLGPGFPPRPERLGGRRRVADEVALLLVARLEACSVGVRLLLEPHPFHGRRLGGGGTVSSGDPHGTGHESGVATAVATAARRAHAAGQLTCPSRNHAGSCVIISCMASCSVLFGP
jgi:hypothetical protein